MVTTKGDGPDLRDYAVKCGIIQPLVNLISPETTVSVKVCVWRGNMMSTS